MVIELRDVLYVLSRYYNLSYERADGEMNVYISSVHPVSETSTSFHYAELEYNLVDFFEGVSLHADFFDWVGLSPSKVRKDIFLTVLTWDRTRFFLAESRIILAYLHRAMVIDYPTRVQDIRQCLDVLAGHLPFDLVGLIRSFVPVEMIRVTATLDSGHEQGGEAVINVDDDILGTLLYLGFGGGRSSEPL